MPYGGGQGSAQTFVMTAFGHWQYSQEDLTDSVNTNGLSVAESSFLASFDGGQAESHGLGAWGDAGKYGFHRGFVPRAGCAYIYEATIALSCTDMTNATGNLLSHGHEVVGIKYRGSISVNGDGTLASYKAEKIRGDYLTLTFNEHDENSIFADTSDPGGAGPITIQNSSAAFNTSDFHIIFAPKPIIDNFTAAWSPGMGPGVSWAQGGVGPSAVNPVQQGPLSFVFWIGNGTGHFVGASVVARVEFTEVGLFHHGNEG